MVNNNSYLNRNRIKLIRGGNQFFSLLIELIERASQFVIIQMYIFQEDETGRLISDALKKAAARNVSVFLTVDGYASQSLSKPFIQGLKDAGINFSFFEPLLKSRNFYFGRRMHKKQILIDGKFGLLGGINIADRYNDLNGHKPWLDYSVYIEGETATRLAIESIAELKRKFKKEPVLPSNLEAFYSNISPNEYCSIRIRRNDWVKGKHEIWKTYFALFNKAQERITIMCSYFLPGIVLRKQLSLAAKRGVKVTVILAGPSDVPLAKYAERYLYDWMFRNNIEVYEYQPTVLHAKVTVVDNHWVTIGSFNINNISTYASIELNLDIRNKPFARYVQGIMDDTITKDCLLISKKSFVSKLTIFKRLMQRSAYDIVRTVLNLATFYFKRE